MIHSLALNQLFNEARTYNEWSDKPVDERMVRSLRSCDMGPNVGQFQSGSIAPRCARANRLCGTEYVSGLFCSARHLHWRTYLGARGTQNPQPEGGGISR